MSESHSMMLMKQAIEDAQWHLAALVKGAFPIAPALLDGWGMTERSSSAGGQTRNPALKQVRGRSSLDWIHWICLGVWYVEYTGLCGLR